MATATPHSTHTHAHPPTHTRTVPSMASSTRVAVVSGSNRGIGLSVVRGLLKSDKFADGDVFVTARDEAKGKEAMELLHKEGLTRAKFHQLDINDEESVKRLASFLKEK